MTLDAGEPGTVGESPAQYWEAEARRHQEVHDRSPDGMMIFRAVRDAAGRIDDFEWRYSNRGASNIVGRRAEDLLGKRLLVEMPGNRDAGLFDIYVRVVELGEPHSHEFPYRHEGLDSWFRATAIKQGDGFYVAFTDLTVRKRAEEQAARLAAIVQSSEHAIYSTSGAGIVQTWNKGAERLYGYTSAEMIGQSILATVPEQCRAEHEEAAAHALGRGGVDSFLTRRLTKAGAVVHVSIMLSPISDLDHRIVGTAVIARDVSEQVKLQERLVVADRLASVGTLAAGMAHEINNPLAYVSANLDVMIEELRVIGGGSPSGRLKELEEMAVQAQGGADRIKKIVRGLMTFSRADEERPGVVDLSRLLDVSVNMAIHEVRQCAALVRDYGPTPPVVADDARLGQVFINLLVNAAQAIGAGNPEANEIRIVTSTDEAGRAVIEVRDSGPGIDGAIIDRVFDPFFTTKPVGVGAGLGLGICRNVVTGMGGEISVSNNDGSGATFRVVLPAALARARPEAGRSARPGSVSAVRRGAVLVVDDEPAIGVILARVLRAHDVTVVTKGREALDVILSGRHFDVILSDLMMPEMSGMELYDALIERCPDVAPRVVFITGGVATPDADKFLDRVANERMSKPFNAMGVRALVQRFVRD